MEWLVIVLIFGAALLPIAWAIPSKRQRYESRQRLYAMKFGFQVSIKSVPMVNPKSEDLIDGAGRRRDATRTLAQYALIVQQKTNTEPNNWHISRSFDVRKPQNAEPELPEGFHWRVRLEPDDEVQLRQIRAALDILPKGVVALERSRHQLAAFWNEAGDEAGIDQLHKALQLLL